MLAGSRHKATKLLDAIGEGGAAAVLNATLQAAQRGDMTAAKIILDRAWPARKSRTVALALPSVETAAGITQALAAVVQAMAVGDIAPDEAAAISAVIEGQRRAIETVELDRRITELEIRNAD
jgi:thioredoxin-like negative regulator of GroEL